MKPIIAVAIIGFLVIASVDAQDQSIGDNNPTVEQSEIIVPMIESDEPGWQPSFEWHSHEIGPGKGADSLNCESRKACDEYKMNETQSREK